MWTLPLDIAGMLRRSGLAVAAAAWIPAATLSHASALEHADDPARYDVLAPLSQPQAFTMADLFDPRAAEAITRHVADLSVRRPDDREAWEVLCQWSAHWWRIETDAAKRARALAILDKADAHLGSLDPNDPAYRVWRAVVLSIESASVGVANSLLNAPRIRDQLERELLAGTGYYHHQAFWVLGVMYLKFPPFPVSIGDLAKAETILTRAAELEPHFSTIRLYLAEAKLNLGKRDEYAKLLAAIPQLGYDSYVGKWFHWSAVQAAADLKRAVDSGTYDRYTWIATLVPMRQPPASWLAER